MTDKQMNNELLRGVMLVIYQCDLWGGEADRAAKMLRELVAKVLQEPTK